VHQSSRDGWRSEIVYARRVELGFNFEQIALLRLTKSILDFRGTELSEIRKVKRVEGGTITKVDGERRKQ